MPEADLLLGAFQYFCPVLPSKLSGCVLTDAYAPHHLVIYLEAVVVVNIEGNHHILYDSIQDISCYEFVFLTLN